MSKNHLIIILAIILIFAAGVLLRLESAYITGTPVEEKSFYLDQNNLPYMYELDSYYNYRLTRNYIEHGYLGDVKVDGQEWDMHSYYPPGVPLDYPPLIVYLASFIYTLVNLFSNVPLLVVVFWISAFVAPLAGVVAYLFTRRVSNESGALVAGILTVLAPFYFIRTVPGWFDTDIFVIIFPILIVWLFWESNHTRNLKNSLIISFLAGFAMFLFATAWNGWQYYFYLILVSSVLWLVVCLIKKWPTKRFLYTLITFILVTLGLLTIFTGYLNVIKLFYAPLEFIKISGSQSPWYPWPDVYISVSELSSVTVDSIVSGIGIAFFGGLFGLVWILRVLLNKDLKEKYLKSMDWFLYTFFILWVLTGFLALLKGSRFIIILIPPLTICTGLMVGLCVEYLNILKFNRLSSNMRKYMIHFLTFVVVLIIVIPSVVNIDKALNMPPGADDNQLDSLEWIKYNTPNNTVVVSGWSAGHLITYAADRPVLMDGRMGYIETLQSRSLGKGYPYGAKSPSPAREYWIDHAFATSNESFSLGIFRMLTTSGDMAFLTMDEYTKNTSKSVEILNQILGVDNQTALIIMINNYNLTQSQAETVLKYTHPRNPSHYVIWTYSGMLYKGFWIYNFGEWNFNNNTSDGEITYSFNDIQLDGDIISDKSGIKADLEMDNVTYKGEVPYCAVKINGSSIDKIYLNQSSDICVFLILDEFKSLIINKKHENSLFIKLAVERENSSHFKYIYKNKDSAVWQERY
ncbi:dolichyl-diphosphooligosaccharide--protein glycosyltransferase subunit STT3 [Methanobacterium sp. YSL]|nr:dolichyl-diphosphooligosaccharide--protein glycosyltransferase subunit STT3 [Methanobacterium sp. YSL]